MTLRQMICMVQRAYGLAEDGVAGPKTWAAIYGDKVLHAAPTPPPSCDISPADERSERSIATLRQEVRPYARALVHAAADQGLTIKVTSGTRTYAEQDALYRQGRETDGPIVTRARGGHSNHNFGIAFDVTLFDADGRPIYESPAYKAIGALGKSLGLTWGGDWTRFVDEPHFELRPAWAVGVSERDFLAELRARQTTQTSPFA